MKQKKNIKPTKRGRPTKKFTLQKPKIKREKVGRPRKYEKNELPKIPENKKEKRKDTIILVLFILSFSIFCLSIYINQKQKIDNFFGSLQIKKENNNQQETIIDNNQKYKTFLQTFYTTLQTKNTEEMLKYIDIPLKKSTTIKTYFSKNRLERFFKNIDNNSFNITLKSINKEENEITYQINYTINTIPFLEERKINITTQENEIKITKIMCTTTGCSKMPFFNPKKYF